ncbi:hypothetical protein ACF0H5_015566 [Mactra antiquata]
MSETDIQRLSLVGVNPNSRSLKFLNTKNNIASLTLKKQLAVYEREKTFSISMIDSQRHDAQSFLKQVKSLEQETEESKRWLSREEIMITPQPEIRRRRKKKRKIRLAQTAPPNGHYSDDDVRHPSRDHKRKETKSGPETQEEKDRMMKIDRKKSVFLQLPGKGRASVVENYYDLPEDKQKRPELPKPSPKTLLEVMIGLNAFSQIPSRMRSNSELSESFRGDSRMSFPDQDSMYDSQENVARRFMTQWKNKVASRKFSLLNKLESTNAFFENPNPRCESINLSSVPEDTSFLNQSRGSHRKSKWTVRHSMKHPSLPAIDDEEERKELFMEWITDQQAKWRSDKESFFKNVPANDKQAQRRKSFICWLQERQTDKKKEDDSDEEPEVFTAGGLRNIIENDAENDDDNDEDVKPANIGELMRTLLNIKSRFKDPLDARVRRFNTEIDNIKRKEEEERNKAMSKSQKRRWKMLMKGIDAALADSSDEEDNYYNTI